MRSDRVGHFASDVELHVCEKKEQNRTELSLFYFARPVSNKQLAKMWKRKLIILPPFFLRPLDYLVRNVRFLHSFAGASINFDRDVLNLYDKYPPQLEFTSSENKKGENELKQIGVPAGASFVCLIVRDSAYLSSETSFDFKNTYRNTDIQNYVLAAEELASRGYYVIRMGVKVSAPMRTANPMIIDYAWNGMRSDFMDIYLGSKCMFCVSNGTGYDAVPHIFRRPIVFVNYLPLEYLCTFRHADLSITKHHYSKSVNRELTATEILTKGIGVFGTAFEFEKAGIDVIENTQEEIRDVVLEMVERLNATWNPNPEDQAMQKRFWEIFKKYSVGSTDPQGKPIHGEIRSSFGTAFLRKNPLWLA